MPRPTYGPDAGQLLDLLVKRSDNSKPKKLDWFPALNDEILHSFEWDAQRLMVALWELERAGHVVQVGGKVGPGKPRQIEIRPVAIEPSEIARRAKLEAHHSAGLLGLIPLDTAPSAATEVVIRRHVLCLSRRKTIRGVWWTEIADDLRGECVRVGKLPNDGAACGLAIARNRAAPAEGGLLPSFRRFWKTLEAVTIPASGGRKIPDTAGAIKLSESAGELYGALSEAYSKVVANHGKPPKKLSLIFQFGVSDSPKGPITPIPDAEIKTSVMTVGGEGADAGLMAALERASKVVGYPVDRQHEKRRYRAQELISEADIETLKSVDRLLSLGESDCSAEFTGADKCVPTRPERLNENAEREAMETWGAAAVLPDCVTRAWDQYEKVAEVLREQLGREPKDQEAYDAIKEAVDRAGKRADGIEPLPEFPTWTAYLRQYRKAHGLQKHKPRKSRSHGSSVRRAANI